MLNKKNLPCILVLMLGAILCLSSCAGANYEYCPTYPIAGSDVAKELENIDFENNVHFWEWLARVDKLRQELELCK